VSAASGVRGLGVEEVAVALEVGIEAATRARGAGSGRLQPNEPAVQDEVAPGDNGRMTPHAAGP